MNKDSDKQLGSFIASIPVDDQGGEDCPSLSELSRFMDGKGSFSERRKVTAHLNRCQSCYELYSEALAVSEELDAAKQPKKDKEPVSIYQQLLSYLDFLIPVSKESVKTRHLIPAFAIILIAVFVVFKQDGTPSYQTLVSSLDETKITKRLVEQINTIPYGSAAFGFFDGLSLERAAFRIGVLAYSLEVTIRTEDGEQSLLLLKPLISLLNELDDQGLVALSFQDLKSQLEKGIFPDSIQPHTGKLEPLMRQQEVSFFMVFGSWVQAGSLAASSGDSSFFRKDDLTYYLTEVEKLGLPPGISYRLQAIDQSLDQKNLTEKALLKIKQDFETILHILM
jgi:hypothetical protein